MIPVKDLMRRRVITFKEDTPIDEVAETLRRRKITGAPVLDQAGEVVGIVSELDVFTKPGRTAGDIMSSHVISVSEETGIDEAARILAGERIRRLPVMSAGKMVGLISRSDVLDFFASSHWACSTCGNTERGLHAPLRCPSCQGTKFTLQRAEPGS
jgi:CBS domain-containing protein